VHGQAIVERELGAEGIGYGENLHKFEKNGGLLSSGRLVLSASASTISRANMHARTVWHTPTSLRYSGMNGKGSMNRNSETLDNIRRLCMQTVRRQTGQYHAALCQHQRRDCQPALDLKCQIFRPAVHREPIESTARLMGRTTC
jgi:hypothetical protein